MSQTDQGYVFRPMPKRGSAFAITAKGWIAIVLTALLGASLAFLLGGIKHHVQAELTYAETLHYVDTYKAERDALITVEKSQGSSKDEIYELAQQARVDGVTQDMTDEDLFSLAPATKDVIEPIIPTIPRWMIFFFAPVLVVAAGNIQFIHNSCFFAEIARWIKNNRAQRDFYSKPYAYIDTHTSEAD